MKKFLERFNKGEELFIGYALLLIAFITTIQVVLRYAFSLSFDWVDEGSRYMTILITFVGAGICIRYSSHFCMDALVQYAPPRGKHLLRALAMFVSSFVMAVICYYSWIQIAKLHKFGATTPVLHLPMYVPYLPIGIFTVIIAMRFFGQGCKHLAALFGKKIALFDIKEDGEKC
jgi:TRAP-type C4-dicarboxylate transport system permease small subunit